jgi:L-lactate dehydrogenase complex protein LldG
MSEPSSRQQILQKISAALQTPTPQPFDAAIADLVVFAPPTDDLDILFAENFARLQGHFCYCAHLGEAVEQLAALALRKGWSKWVCAESDLRQLLAGAGGAMVWHQHLADCNAAITSCEALVARTGSMVLSAVQSGGRGTSVYAPAHVCVARRSQLVFDVADALQLLSAKYSAEAWPSLISFASGPSRTADIEKTLVTGVHGPKEVYCFLIDD